eukprot:7178754-Prymnesium_polylepis.1
MCERSNASPVRERSNAVSHPCPDPDSRASRLGHKARVVLAVAHVERHLISGPNWRSVGPKAQELDKFARFLVVQGPVIDFEAERVRVVPWEGKGRGRAGHLPHIALRGEHHEAEQRDGGVDLHHPVQGEQVSDAIGQVQFITRLDLP